MQPWTEESLRNYGFLSFADAAPAAADADADADDSTLCFAGGAAHEADEVGLNKLNSVAP